MIKKYQQFVQIITENLFKDLKSYGDFPDDLYTLQNILESDKDANEFIKQFKN